MIHHTPKDTYVEVKSYVCEYHKTHRNSPNYAGCTCSTSYALKVGKEKKDGRRQSGDLPGNPEESA